MRFLKYLLMIAFIGIAIFALNQMSHHAQAADITWDGGGADNKASTAQNWVGDVAPIAGDTPIFSAVSSKDCAWDLSLNHISAFKTYSGYNGSIVTSVYIECWGPINIADGNIIIGAPWGGGYLNISHGHIFLYDTIWLNGCELYSGSITGDRYHAMTILGYGIFYISAGDSIDLPLIMSTSGWIDTNGQTLYSLTINNNADILQTGPVYVGAGGYYLVSGSFTGNPNYPFVVDSTTSNGIINEFNIWMILIFFLILTIISFAAYAMHIGLLNIITLIIMMIAIPLSNDLWTEYWPFVLMFGLVNAILVLMTWMRK